MLSSNFANVALKKPRVPKVSNLLATNVVQLKFSKKEAKKEKSDLLKE